MRILKYILSIVLVLIITACEEVIDVELNNVPPRLVIDAAINWQKGTDGKDQVIKLSLTAPFFNGTIQPATGATINITDTSNNTFNFIEEASSGIYKNNSFIPVINGVYNLNITYNNEQYSATETLIPVVPIEYVEQKNDGGFSGDQIELKAFYTDPIDIENFYLFEFNIVKYNTTFLDAYNDEFTDGSQIFAFYTNDDMELVDEIIITNHGLSERAFEFYNILLQQKAENNGGPFETQPATVRGNCNNQTNPDNFPLGYFRVSEIDVFSYIIE
ncbi:DUF4249 domain-containing protein [uncultured Algibacter sp.]|uniref:DUF4249 domain-containing protein n=1 Tax=uncultured Algibacter sp. TaxID=298659 RepID=UPI0026287937|nr:DUF4249 domain-containing protein [uncultured Algibacter sp.]